ncbi:MAG: antibiotic biosynthesis monooxygenase [Planctomycetota bacterium]|nr:antibiotic biosynthesis monooxygenase [Planctomycetota bacterium]
MKENANRPGDFVAVNRIRVRAGGGERLVEAFCKGQGLEDVPGFLSFELLRCVWRPQPQAGVEEFLSVSRWSSADAFLAWTRSEHFKRVHAGPKPEGILSSEPAGFEVAVARTPAVQRA